MNVYWTETAMGQLDRIYEYIGETSMVYALRMVDRITRCSEQIAAFPGSGRMVPEFDRYNIREVIEGPYRIIYSIEEDTIDILAVVHGAQDAGSWKVDGQ